MKSQILSLAATALTFSQFVSGQTSTSCNPLTNTTCPSDTALGKTITVDFTQGENSEFSEASGTSITYGASGAELTVSSDGLAQTITSVNYIFFGKVEIAVRAANGTGIVSSFVMESDDLDEIDWEWASGFSNEVETNYFGKGNTTTYNRATYPAVTDPTGTWHIYTIDWTSEYIKWYVDGDIVRTLLYADALAGKNFPQTPTKIKIGVWDGGAADEAEGTVEWAGGYTDLSEAPFTMYVANITIQDYTTNGTTYTYGDKSGSYTSILISDNTTSASTSYSSGSSVGTSNSSSSTTTSTNSSSGGSASASASARSSSSVLAVGGAIQTGASGSFWLGVMGLGYVLFYALV